MMKTAAITGSASGIGQAAARRLLEQGWTVFGLDAARERLDATAAQFASHAALYQAVSAHAAAVHELFVSALGASACSYAATEAANASSAI